MSCLYACAYVWAGVCGCVWLRLIRSSWESSPLGYISSCHTLSLVRSLQCLRSTFTVCSGSAIPEPCCFLDSDRRTLAAHCFPALPASALRKAPFSAYGKLCVCLRKLHLCPTESSVFCLRKAPRLPTEAPPLPYGKLRFLPTESSASAYGSSASALRKAPFSFSLCITSCNKLSFPQLNPPVFIVTLSERFPFKNWEWFFFIFMLLFFTTSETAGDLCIHSRISFEI